MAKRLNKKTAKESQAPKKPPTPEQRQTALRDAAREIHGLQASVDTALAKAAPLSQTL